MKTVLEILDSTTAYFQKHQVPSPRLQIEILLAHVLNIPRLQLYLQFDRPIESLVLDKLRPLVQRRAKREPLQYILGSVDFMGYRLEVTPDVLIPRPETELFVEKVIGEIALRPFETIADVGTGSGAIAIALAKKFSDRSIIALDNSTRALEVARRNAESLKCSNITFLQSDLLQACQDIPQAIVANLPYLNHDEMRSLDPELLHEPSSALDGGPDGTALIVRLIQQCAGKCHAIFLETGISHTKKIAEALEYHGFKPQIYHDYTDHPRFIFSIP